MYAPCMYVARLSTRKARQERLGGHEEVPVVAHEPREAETCVEGDRVQINGMDDHYLEPDAAARVGDPLERMQKKPLAHTSAMVALIDGEPSEQHRGDRISPRPETSHAGCLVRLKAVRGRRVVAGHPVGGRIDREEGARVVCPLLLARLRPEPVVQRGVTAPEA